MLNLRFQHSLATIFKKLFMTTTTVFHITLMFLLPMKDVENNNCNQHYKTFFGVNLDYLLS